MEENQLFSIPDLSTIFRFVSLTLRASPTFTPRDVLSYCYYYQV
jgi:hypothetical protein